ncbi:hypothetical protein PanWU01x14_116060 [Parasponia andersonii]|uniref:Uncharacterized protein n=1 Tax=Parasponia andersonii TaxID=3476 RepID=A0A2P5CX20_PARAD|nr:hypothetical protein PanWU01x14_116060 [Parasponia andersonii]
MGDHERRWPPGKRIAWLVFGSVKPTRESLGDRSQLFLCRTIGGYYRTVQYKRRAVLTKNEAANDAE